MGRRARLALEWTEADGDVLWWRFPIDEPPYVGSPLDDGFPGYHTHWSAIDEPLLDGEPDSYSINADDVLGQVAHEIMARRDEPLLERAARGHGHLVRLGMSRYADHLEDLGPYDPVTDRRPLEADIGEELADALVYLGFHRQRYGSGDRALEVLQDQLELELATAWVTLAKLRARRRFVESGLRPGDQEPEGDGRLRTYQVQGCRECGAPMQLVGEAAWSHLDDGSAAAARCSRGPARTLVWAADPAMSDGCSRAICDEAALLESVQQWCSQVAQDPRGHEGEAVTIEVARMTRDELDALPDL